MKTQNIIKLEDGSDLNKIVIPFKIAEQLKELGIPQKSIFGYYQNDNFICSAYTFEEIIDFIPEMIEITEDTYIARFDGYDKISKEDLETNYADVTYQKTQVGDKPYMAICRCMERMVAFSVTEEGLYNNLIYWGENQAEAAGLMLIELIKENKIDMSYTIRIVP